MKPKTKRWKRKLQSYVTPKRRKVEDYEEVKGKPLHYVFMCVLVFSVSLKMYQ